MQRRQLCPATVLAAILMLGGACSLPASQPNADRLTTLARSFGRVDSLMRAFAESNHVPGIAYGIVVDGKVAHAKALGLRDVAAQAPVDTATVFRIASMTKSFTALTILKLRDEGKLSLDDPAERYVPELKALRYPTSDSPKITVRHLLSHSAGFPEDNPWGDQQLAASEADFSRMIAQGIPFSNAPGTAYEYSNYGFALLGRVISNVTGMRYTDYLRQQVLAPLGMTSTTMEFGQVPASRLAHGYRRQDDAWVEETPLPDGAFGSMGGMLTSIADLGRWVGFMLAAWPPRDGPEVGPVRRSSVREMQQVSRFSGGTAGRDAEGHTTMSAGGYGYGLGVRQTCAFRHSVAHSGGLPGYGSQMRWLPDYGVGIVAMGNLTYTSWGTVIEQALGVLAATGGLTPKPAAPAPILLIRKDQATRLVNRWDDRLADSLAAMNLFLDESKPRRQQQLSRIRDEAGGSCQANGPFSAENALRGQWRMSCSKGDLRVAITLAPTEPAGVQFLEVTPLKPGDTLGPPPACR